MSPVEVQYMEEPEVLDYGLDCDVVSDASTEEQIDAPLARTQSQVTKQKKVQQVTQRLSERHRPVEELLAATSSLVARSPEGLAQLGECLEEIDCEQRRARNLGEDLLEDTLALDSLVNLFAEDRAARKVALADIDLLTDKVDSAKSALLKRRREIEKALSEEEQAVKEAQVQDEAGRQAEARETKDVPSQAQSPPPVQQKRAPALPSAEDWANVKLPLRFQSRAVSDGYVVVADAPGLSAEDLQLEFEGDDVLRLSGLRVPSREEVVALHRFLQRKLGRQQLSLEDYLSAGEGCFGGIDEAVRLPEDVDRSGIQATCRNGQLRLSLPRQRPRRAPAPGFGSAMRRSPRGAVDPFAAFRGAGIARSPRFPGW